MPTFVQQNCCVLMAAGCLLSYPQPLPGHTEVPFTHCFLGLCKGRPSYFWLFLLIFLTFKNVSPVSMDMGVYLYTEGSRADGHWWGKAGEEMRRATSVLEWTDDIKQRFSKRHV